MSRLILPPVFDDTKHSNSLVILDAVSRMPLDVQRFDSNHGEWTRHKFANYQEKYDFISSIQKLPGECKYDSRIKMVAEHGRFFDENGFYSLHQRGTYDYNNFWDRLKTLCYTGILIDDDFYVPGDEFWYLNFIKIPDKVKGDYSFPRLQDLDIWAYQNVERAILSHKILAILKARQTGFTLKFLARLMKRLWFEKTFVGKIAAFDERFVELSWTDVLLPYRSHLNEHTGWPRAFELADKALNWKQGYYFEEEGRVRLIAGNNSRLLGVTTKEKPSAVVAGKTDEVLYDEAGVSRNLDKTLEFALPALSYGNVKTGFFTALGAAGETSESASLRGLILDPEANGCLTFPNVWSNKEEDLVGMFVPFYYAFGDCLDEFGNSLIPQAEEAFKEMEEAAAKKSFQAYALFKAQYPRFIEDAFASQEDNIFTEHIIRPHFNRLLKTYNPITVTLQVDSFNQNKAKYRLGSDSPPLLSHKVGKNEDKRGAMVVDEFPPDDPPFGLYYMAVDPTKVVKTKTSKSLFSFHIYKAAHRRENDLVSDKLVAWYCGRYDNPKQNFEMARLAVLMFNARVAIENDQPSCAEWFQTQRMQAWMLKRNDMPILKDLVKNTTVDSSEYGFKTGSGPVKDYILNLIVEYTEEIIGERTLANGESVPIYGVERINDIALLSEMLHYNKNDNFDRLISFGGALMAAKSNTNRGLMVVERRPETRMDFKQQPVAPRPSLTSPLASFGRKGTKRSKMKSPLYKYKNAN